MKEYLACLFAGIIIHPVHVIEARYVIQNRIPNFQSYRNLMSMVVQSQGIMLKGVTMWIPRSVAIALSSINYTNSSNIFAYFASQNLLYALVYPFLTI